MLARLKAKLKPLTLRNEKTVIIFYHGKFLSDIIKQWAKLFQTKISTRKNSLFSFLSGFLIPLLILLSTLSLLLFLAHQSPLPLFYLAQFLPSLLSLPTAKSPGKTKISINQALSVLPSGV